ncbi:hypothetical protein M434DRAFT_201998 [Hypoxylon sp. CO27-5]|nr:hypothetical protein M434DRAFT_201998 [Hypoxylon sp. CO27-5]
MPSALIWGGLKHVLECFSRYSVIFDKIEGQLRKLAQELKRMKEYEELFKESALMQELLVQTYINIIHFWAEVKDICLNSAIVLAAKLVTSNIVKKLAAITEFIAAYTSDITKLMLII